METQTRKHQQITRIAHTIYLNRQRRNQPGDAQTDWDAANAIAHSLLRTLLFIRNQPLLRLQHSAFMSVKLVVWDMPRWFLFTFPKLEWMKLIAVPLILAAAGSVISSQIQKESNQIDAFNLYLDQLERLTFDQKLLEDNPNTGAIVMARGRTVAALHDLDIKRTRQLIALLQASGLLGSVDPEAEPIISFRSTNLSNLNLTGIDLRYADLDSVDLHNTNLQETWLDSASLVEAHLDNANLSGASLESTNLAGADLGNVNLAGADLDKANLTRAILYNTNLDGAKGILQSQLSQALLCQTILPDEIAIDPNRDCEELSNF